MQVSTDSAFYSVRIYTPSQSDKKAWADISKNPTTKIYETHAGFSVADLAKNDYESLRNKKVTMERLPPPQSKEKLPVPLPSTARFYEVYIPYFPLNGQKEMVEQGFPIIERIKNDTYLVYLSPQNVKKAFQLPFVWGLSLHHVHYNRDGVLHTLKQGAARAAITYAEGTAEELEKFIESWRVLKGKQVTIYKTHYALKIDFNDVDLTDALAQKPCVLAIIPEGQPLLA